MAVDSPAKVQAVVRPVVVAAPTGGAGVLRRTASKKQIVVQLDSAVPTTSTSSHPVLRDDTNKGQEVDDEEVRAVKRRRTSSPPVEHRDVKLHVTSDDDNFAVAPVEFDGVPQEELVLAAPDAGWEDLDAEDVNDPLMVSEYVVEIFDYLKRVEVCHLSMSVLS